MLLPLTQNGPLLDLVTVLIMCLLSSLHFLSLLSLCSLCPPPFSLCVHSISITIPFHTTDSYDTSCMDPHMIHLRWPLLLLLAMYLSSPPWLLWNVDPCWAYLHPSLLLLCDLGFYQHVCTQDSSSPLKKPSLFHPFHSLLLCSFSPLLLNLLQLAWGNGSTHCTPVSSGTGHGLICLVVSYASMP